VSKEKEITIIDDTVTDTYPNGKPVTINKPINRIVGLNTNVPEALRTVKSEEKMVGISKATADKKIFFPEISKLPIVGAMGEDVERIISLNPDIVIGYGSDVTYFTIDLEDKLKDTGIILVRLDFNRPETTIEDIRKLGYILDKEAEAAEFIAFYESCLDPIAERVEALSEDEKPRIYLEMWKPYQVTAQGTGPHKVCIMGGGINIAADLVGYPVVDPEWVMEQNPEFIIRITSDDGYELDDSSKMKAIRDEIMNRPELANVNAVKNGKVYTIDRQATFIRHFVGVAYMAKWFHPELFDDLDPGAINKEYIERFQGMPYQGVYVYTEPS
jgi:iron complex transport system substrate-binding protein